MDAAHSGWCISSCHFFFQCLSSIDVHAQVVSGKYKGEDKFFTLAMYAGRFYAVSEACGRCKFPLVRANKLQQAHSILV